MLKLITQERLKLNLKNGYLNTSHVKVNLVLQNLQIQITYDLNTSHVKVNPYSCIQTR